MACFDSEYGHALDSVPQGDYLTDNLSKKIGVQITHLLLAFHVYFSFPDPPIFELKWSILLSSLCLRKVLTWPPFGGSKVLIFRLPLDSAHPMP